MRIAAHINSEFTQLEKLVGVGETSRTESRKNIDQYRMDILTSADRKLFDERRSRALEIGSQSETDHHGLINYLAVLLLRSERDVPVNLPPTLNLQRFGDIFRSLHKEQMDANREFARDGYLDWEKLSLRFVKPEMGDEFSVQRSGKMLLRIGEFPSVSIHTHPTIDKNDPAYSLHFSHGDFFTFECNIYGMAAVICEAGALLIIKKGSAVSPRSVGDSLAKIKATMVEKELDPDKTPGARIRAFTGAMCREFGYDLYRIRDLNEMVARQVEL